MGDQMAQALRRIQLAGNVLTDSKITNWLVDDNGTLRIADSKSSMFTDSEGFFSPQKVVANKYYSICANQGFIPPELFEPGAQADSVHAYILGKNLYIAMTGKYGLEDEGDLFDYSDPIFNTEQGKQIKTLIQDLVQTNPNNRSSIQTACNEFFIISHPEWSGYLRTVQKLALTKNDSVVNDFLTEKIAQIEKANPDEQEVIRQELQQWTATLQTAGTVTSRLQRIHMGVGDTAIPALIQNHAARLATVPLLERAAALEALGPQVDALYSLTQQYQHFMTNLQEIHFCDKDDFMDLYGEQCQAQINATPLSDRAPLMAGMLVDLSRFKAMEQQYHQLVTTINTLASGGDTWALHMKRYWPDRTINCLIEQRGPLIEVMAGKIQAIQVLAQRTHDVFALLEQQRIGPNDTAMNGFILSSRLRLSEADPHSREPILSEIESTAQRLVANSNLTIIKNIAKQYANQSSSHSILSYGKGTKAQNIEAQTAKLSIEARLNPKGERWQAEIGAVEESLKAKRFLGKSKAFETYKEQLAQLKEQEENTAPNPPSLPGGKP